MRHRRPGGQSRDAPAGDGGDRGGQRRIPGVSAAAERESRHACAFGGKLQAAGGGGIKPPHLADDAGEAAMAQPLLHGEEHAAGGIDEQYAVGDEADLGQGGREEIGALGDPEDRPVETREDARNHEPGGSRVFQGWAGVGEFMQGAKAQAAFRQVVVDGVDAEGQRGAGGFGRRPSLQPGKCLA